MLLVGSKALQYYIPDLGRVTHDWDIWMTEAELKNLLLFENPIKTTKHSSLFEIDGQIFEIKSVNQFEPTDSIIFNMEHPATTKTPLGNAFVPSIQVIYDMKYSTSAHIDEPKHKYDAALIANTFSVQLFTDLYKARLAETGARVSKSKQVKYDFFHKYHIPEYIYHDNLHTIIADLLDISIPTYQRITTADTDISEDLFNKLTHEQKISLMVEESLVLCLERWLIPQMVENGINYRLIDMFYSNNEGLPTYNILRHCCITGLKGEAEYITAFSRANFFEIEKQWQAAKQKIKEKNGFPMSFFDQLFKLREDFKSNKKIAIT